MDVSDHVGLAAHMNPKEIDFTCWGEVLFWLVWVRETSLRPWDNSDDDVLRWMRAVTLLHVFRTTSSLTNVYLCFRFWCFCQPFMHLLKATKEDIEWLFWEAPSLSFRVDYKTLTKRKAFFFHHNLLHLTALFMNTHFQFSIFTDYLDPAKLNWQ